MGHEALEDALRNYLGHYADPTAEKIICKCFHVTESQIVVAVQENGLKTVDEVTNFTKAGGACGHCKNAIQAILDKINGKPEVTSSTMSETQKILKINKIIEQQIAPELQKDGGDIELVDIVGNQVYVKLHGKCSGCRNSLITLKNFVESTLKSSVSADIEVIQIG